MLATLISHAPGLPCRRRYPLAMASTRPTSGSVTLGHIRGHGCRICSSSVETSSAITAPTSDFLCRGDTLKPPARRRSWASHGSVARNPASAAMRRYESTMACIVCNTANCERQQGAGDFVRYDCPRCGVFVLSGSAEVDLPAKLSEDDLRPSVVSHTLRRMQRPNARPRILTSDDLPPHARKQPGRRRKRILIPSRLLKKPPDKMLRI
jgi:hypothetical protein